MTAQGLGLCIEDEKSIAAMTRPTLERNGYRLVHARDGCGAPIVSGSDRPGWSCSTAISPDVDGVEVCRRSRSSPDVPVIMPTPRDGEIDKAVGLETGNDDYVTRPFSPRELAARVEAALRRSEDTVRFHGG